MAAYGSSQYASTTAATSVTITKPTGLAAGDLMVAFISEQNSGGTPNTPSGWTLVLAMNDITEITGLDAYVFAKVADSADAAASNFTFSYSGSNTNIQGILYRITGTFAAANNVYASTFDIDGVDQSDDVFRCSPGITPSVASSLLIMYSFALTGVDGPSVSAFAIETSNPSWTEDHDVQESALDMIISSAHATRTETTDTGYYQITFNTASGDVNDVGGILLAIADTQNGTHNASVVTATAAVQAPSPSGEANITVGVVTATATINEPTATGGTNDALWKNTQKPSPGSITNTTKPV